MTDAADPPVAEEPLAEVEDTPQKLSWEWHGDPPDVDEVKLKLAERPSVMGIDPADYWEFVQPLAQNKKISRKGEPDQYVTAWTLYFTVAGRIAMANAAAEENGWNLDLEPEQRVPEGNGAGYLQFDENRIVYREYAVFYKAFDDGSTAPVGRKPGTAWVPAQGGANAVASNRFEKVETSARGRALAAWGFGVLPGSGVASLEEMRDAASMGLAERDQQTRQRTSSGSRRGQSPRAQEPRADVVGAVRVLMAEYGEASGLDEAAIDAKVVSFCKRTFSKEVKRSPDPENPEEMGGWEFGELTDGEVAILRRRLSKEIQDVKNASSEL